MLFSTDPIHSPEAIGQANTLSSVQELIYQVRVVYERGSLARILDDLLDCGPFIVTTYSPNVYIPGSGYLLPLSREVSLRNELRAYHGMDMQVPAEPLRVRGLEAIDAAPAPSEYLAMPQTGEATPGPSNIAPG